jgi:hypothetical protein
VATSPSAVSCAGSPPGPRGGRRGGVQCLLLLAGVQGHGRDVLLHQAAAVPNRPRLQLQGGVVLFECYCREMSYIGFQRIRKVAIYHSPKRQQSLIGEGYSLTKVTQKAFVFFPLTRWKNALWTARSRTIGSWSTAAIAARWGLLCHGNIGNHFV